MKTNFILIILFFINTNVYAQNKKISIEVNYPVVVSNELDVNYPGIVSIGTINRIENLTGIVNLSVNYKFAKNEIFNFGTSFAIDHLRGNSSLSNPVTYPEGFSSPIIDLNSSYYFYHINGFTEMTIPSIEKLHPLLGFGFTYTYYYYELFKLIETNPSIESEKEKNLGFNLKLGLQYDLNNSFFIQSYYHFIRTFNKSEYKIETSGVNYNLLKFGLGYRF